MEHGEIYDVTITDTLTPPSSDYIKAEMVKEEDGENRAVEVWIMKDGERIDLKPADYEIVEESSSGNKNEKTFMVKLKGEYNPLEDGEELYVSYQYKVEFTEDKEREQLFWAQVKNVAKFKGTIKTKDPNNPEGAEKETPTDQEWGSQVEVFKTASGSGVILKDEDYDEYKHTLHYTLYTGATPGQYKPFYIQDQMTVNYDGKLWYVDAFNNPGLFQNLKVSVVDNPPEDVFEGNVLTIEQYREMMDRYKETLEPLREELMKYYHYDKISLSDPGSYRFENMDEYVWQVDNANGIWLKIFFGLSKDTPNGSWDYKKKRLIITEYDLNLAEEGKIITLQSVDTNDQR